MNMYLRNYMNVEELLLKIEYSLYLKTNVNVDKSFRFAHFNFMSMQIKHDIQAFEGKNLKS